MINIRQFATLSLIVVVTSIGTSASAQNRVSTMSVFLKPGQVIPAQCQQEAQTFKQIASIYPHPKTSWSFIVVCDEGSWRAALERIGITNENPIRSTTEKQTLTTKLRYFVDRVSPRTQLWVNRLLSTSSCMSLLTSCFIVVMRGR
jgi:hypothetical protein